MKNIAPIAIALLASAAFGEPSGPYMSYLGYDVGKSGSGEYSNYIGAYSGQYSTGISRCGFYGAASGQYGYKLYGCNGVGFYALANSEYMTNVFAVGTSAGRGASHCEDCIFIGKDVGRGVSNKNGYVNINNSIIIDHGGKAYFPNGIVGFEGLLYKTVLDIVTNKYEVEWLFTGGDVDPASRYTIEEYKPNEWIEYQYLLYKDGDLISTCIGSGIERWYVVDFNGALDQRLDIVATRVNDTANAFGIAFLKDIPSTNGFVKIEQVKSEVAKPRTSLPITDEDTGEKYIIKVKSGALKLYKVEETEE